MTRYLLLVIITKNIQVKARRMPIRQHTYWSHCFLFLQNLIEKFAGLIARFPTLVPIFCHRDKLVLDFFNSSGRRHSTADANCCKNHMANMNFPSNEMNGSIVTNSRFSLIISAHRSPFGQYARLFDVPSTPYCWPVGFLLNTR